MYIMVVARGYPSEKYRMNGIFEFDQAKALTKAGHKVIYVATDIRSIRRWRKWGVEVLEKDSIQIYAINIPLGRIPRAIRQQISIIGLKRLYPKIIREQGKPDIIHAHFASAGYTVSQVIRNIGIPFVMTEHLSAIMNPIIDKRLFNIASKAYESADALIAVSPGLKDVLMQKFNKEAIYIPNIVDTNLFTYSPLNSNQKDSMFRFVSIGTLIQRKRMDLTIEAFVRAFGQNKSVTLTIFGEGPERNKLESLIRKHEIGDRVILKGLQSREMISEYFKVSDCFVLPSQAETFGVVYIEALASGIPVIATKCGGPDSLINDGNGIIIPVDDREALVNAMKDMYKHINKYDKELISRKTTEQFSPKSVANSLTEVYKDLI